MVVHLIAFSPLLAGRHPRDILPRHRHRQAVIIAEGEPGRCSRRLYVALTHQQRAFLREWPYLILFLLSLLWLFGSAAVYIHALEPYCSPMVNGTVVCVPVTYAMATYFSVQAGLSVGFGLLSERSGGWLYFSVIQGAIGCVFISALLGLAVIKPLQLLEPTVEALLRRCELVRGERPRLRAWLLELLPLLALLVWLGIGTTFEVCYNKWTFGRALYFAFFALSTGGLQAPGTVDDAEMWFVAAFVFSGVPVLAAVVGHASSQFTAAALRLNAWAVEQEQRVDGEETPVGGSGIPCAAVV